MPTILQCEGRRLRIDICDETFDNGVGRVVQRQSNGYSDET